MVATSRFGALLLAVLLPACAHTRSLNLQPRAGQDAAAQLNHDLHDRAVAVVLGDGTRFDARDVMVTGSGVSFRPADAQQPRTSDIAAVRELSFRSHLRGALDGLMVGFLAGLPAGALLVDPPPGERWEGHTKGALAGGVSLGVWGAVIAAVRGSRMVYRMRDQAPTRPRQD